MHNLKNIEKIIKEKYGNSSDLVFRYISKFSNSLMYVYLESVSSDDKISDFLVKNISNNNKNLFEDTLSFLKNSIYSSHLYIETNLEECFTKLSNGFTLIFVQNSSKFISIETKIMLDRGVVESTSESIIRGPKDSFTENNSKNIGLIRKRIKTNDLWFKEIIVGTKTKTKVTVSYINGVADKEKIEILLDRISKINIDGILDSGYIREFLCLEKKNFFPKIKSTERPDLASMSLLEGKIVILVENSPFVLITPSTLIDYIHTPEDYYQKWKNVNVTRILRFISFILTIVTPAFYVAVTTFNQEMIPNELLISLAIQQDGVPFPTAFEVLMMMITFEILRETDIRIPSPMGASISIVGALVLGEAAVSAGVVSPIVIIVVAITSTCGLLFTDIDFVNALRFWRFVFLLFATISGMIGIILATILLIFKLAEMDTDGVPYLEPFSPLHKEELKDSIIKAPINKLNKRPRYLTNNIKKLGEKNV